MPSFLDRSINWFKYSLIPWFTSLGLTKGTVTLEVVGRKSGRPVQVSVTTVCRDGQRFIVSLYSQAQWVQNLRAANGQAVIISGRRRPVRLLEVPVSERAPVLLGYVSQRAFSHSGDSSARLFFGLKPHPSLEQMQAVAHRYPVFLVEE